jgi:hypothetical protein
MSAPNTPSEGTGQKFENRLLGLTNSFVRYELLVQFPRCARDFGSEPNSSNRLFKRGSEVVIPVPSGRPNRPLTQSFRWEKPHASIVQF